MDKIYLYYNIYAHDIENALNAINNGFIQNDVEEEKLKSLFKEMLDHLNVSYEEKESFNHLKFKVGENFPEYEGFRTIERYTSYDRIVG